jgi:hypothetical protein
MADAFTLTVKTAAITRYAERRRFTTLKTIQSYMAEIERQVALKLPLSEVKGLVIDMRAWAWYGRLDEWTWLDDRLDELAHYLSTPEERLSNQELAARLEKSLLEASNR